MSLDSSNNFTLIGTLQAQPILRVTSGGKDVTELLVLHADRFGETLFSVTVWGAQAKKASSIPKGSRVVCDGKLTSRPSKCGNFNNTGLLCFDVDVEQVSVPEVSKPAATVESFFGDDVPF